MNESLVNIMNIVHGKEVRTQKPIIDTAAYVKLFIIKILLILNQLTLFLFLPIIIIDISDPKYVFYHIDLFGCV